MRYSVQHNARRPRGAHTSRRRGAPQRTRVLGGLLLIGAAVALFVGVAFAQAQAGGATAQASQGKHILAAPQPVHTLHKQVAHNAALVTSCASATLPQAGVVNIVPPSTTQYQLDSVAIGVWGGRAYQLFGGALRSDPSQGVIVITPLAADPCHAQALGANSQPAVITTPTHGGRVMFTSVAGRVIAFTTADGKPGRLDYASRVFVG